MQKDEIWYWLHPEDRPENIAADRREELEEEEEFYRIRRGMEERWDEIEDEWEDERERSSALVRCHNCKNYSGACAGRITCGSYVPRD